MGRNRYVNPTDVERLPLSDGDWVEIKRKLNNGETKKLEAAGLKPPALVGGKVISPIDWEVYEIERASIFLTDWSFRDKDDKPTKPSMSTLKAIDPESFAEINEAILKYTIDQAAKAEAAKKLLRDSQTEVSSSSKESETTSETTPSS